MTIVDKQKTGNRRQKAGIGSARSVGSMGIHGGGKERNPESKVQKSPPAKQYFQAISWEQAKFPRLT